MLPRLLCEDLCSLNPGVERLTFSVEWEMTPEGEILSEWFGRGVIRSCAKLDYGTAQQVIEALDEGRTGAEELLAAAAIENGPVKVGPPSSSSSSSPGFDPVVGRMIQAKPGLTALAFSASNTLETKI